MSKVVIRLHLPEPGGRKKTAKAVQPHRNKMKYARKAKHKRPPEEMPGAFYHTGPPSRNVSQLSLKSHLLFRR